MVKNTPKFTILLSSLIALSGCSVNLGFVKFGDESKQVIEDSTQPNEETPNSQSEDSEQPSQETAPSFEYMKSFATNVVVKTLDMEESEVTFGEYDDNTLPYYPDIYLYNKSDLMFVSADMEIENKGFIAVIDDLKALLPSDATYEKELSTEIDLVYGDCDLWYKSGCYYYIIFAEDWTDFDFVWAKFDIVPVSQAEKYLEVAYDEDWDSDDYEDMSDEEWEEYLNSLEDDDFE